MNTLYNKKRPKGLTYKHLESIEGLFYNRVSRYKIVSVNGFAVDISRFNEDFRITRFVRDPRDLIVSGYFYHKKGAEPWFRFKSPNLKYWSPINGNVPPSMPNGVSYAEYLQSLSLEDGLIAEIQFRKYHLESLRKWPDDDRIMVFKYENILGNEKKVFDRIFRFYELPFYERKLGVWLANYYSFKNRRNKTRHIRNPEPGQWKKYFTPKIEKYFNDRYGDIIGILGYSE